MTKMANLAPTEFAARTRPAPSRPRVPLSLCYTLSDARPAAIQTLPGSPNPQPSRSLPAGPAGISLDRCSGQISNRQLSVLEFAVIHCKQSISHLSNRQLSAISHLSPVPKPKGASPLGAMGRPTASNLRPQLPNFCRSYPSIVPSRIGRKSLKRIARTTSYPSKLREGCCSS
jgi:hypothetical protein